MIPSLEVVEVRNGIATIAYCKGRPWERVIRAKPLNRRESVPSQENYVDETDCHGITRRVFFADKQPSIRIEGVTYLVLESKSVNNWR